MDWVGTPSEDLIDPNYVEAYPIEIFQWAIIQALERITDSSRGAGLILVPTYVALHNIATALRSRGSLIGVTPSCITEITGQSSGSLRREVMQAIEDNNVRCVVATKAWNTGIDIPELDWIILDPAVGSPGVVIQSSGRGSRLAIGKSQFEILVPPGIHAARQLSALHEAGYPIQEETPTPSIPSAPTSRPVVYPSDQNIPAPARTSLSMASAIFWGLLVLIGSLVLWFS